LADALRCAGVRLRWAVERLRLLAVERLPVEFERLRLVVERVPVEVERLVLLRRVLLRRVPLVLFWVAI
jgi:hypothetical protein